MHEMYARRPSAAAICNTTVTASAVIPAGRFLVAVEAIPFLQVPESRISASLPPQPAVSLRALRLNPYRWSSFLRGFGARLMMDESHQLKAIDAGIAGVG